jgi:hypothetical protein
MRPWVDRVTFLSSALQYITNIILNLLIVVGGIMLFMIGGLFLA